MNIQKSKALVLLFCLITLNYTACSGFLESEAELSSKEGPGEEMTISSSIAESEHGTQSSTVVPVTEAVSLSEEARYQTDYHQDELTQSVHDSLERDNPENWVLSLRREGRIVRTYPFSQACRNAEGIWKTWKTNKVFRVYPEDDFPAMTEFILEGDNWRIIAAEGCDYVKYENPEVSGTVVIHWDYDNICPAFEELRSWFSESEYLAAMDIRIDTADTDPLNAAALWLNEFESNLLLVDPLCYEAVTWVRSEVFLLTPLPAVECKAGETAVYRFMYDIDRLPLNDRFAGFGGENRYHGRDDTVPEGAWSSTWERKLVRHSEGYWYVRD